MNKKDYNLRPCFAFTSKKLTVEPLRLYLNSYSEGEKCSIDNFSLASNYYIENVENGDINIS